MHALLIKNKCKIMKKYTRKKKILLKVNGHKEKIFSKSKEFWLKMMEIGKK
jgi:hypothetical protein